MREILFRGKFGNEWKYGFLSIEPQGLVIKEPYNNYNTNVWHIDSNTVGQYTGFKDKDGNKIFEGDIVDFPDRSDSESYGVVKYDTNETEFGIVYDSIYKGLGRQYHSRDIEVIGNIFDNPGGWEMKIMSEKELKIREVCGDYALDIPFADGSVNTIYFNSKRNAETVKHIIEVDGSKPDEATVCEMEEIKHGKWLVKDFDLKELEEYIHPYGGLHGTPFCSKCGRNALLNGCEEYVDSNYCPYCGTKMDLER